MTDQNPAIPTSIDLAADLRQLETDLARRRALIDQLFTSNAHYEVLNQAAAEGFQLIPDQNLIQDVYRDLDGTQQLIDEIKRRRDFIHNQQTEFVRYQREVELLLSSTPADHSDAIKTFALAYRQYAQLYDDLEVLTAFEDYEPLSQRLGKLRTSMTAYRQHEAYQVVATVFEILDRLVQTRLQFWRQIKRRYEAVNQRHNEFQSQIDAYQANPNPDAFENLPRIDQISAYRAANLVSYLQVAGIESLDPKENGILVQIEDQNRRMSALGRSIHQIHQDQLVAVEQRGRAYTDRLAQRVWANWQWARLGLAIAVAVLIAATIFAFYVLVQEDFSGRLAAEEQAGTALTDRLDRIEVTVTHLPTQLSEADFAQSTAVQQGLIDDVAALNSQQAELGRTVTALIPTETLPVATHTTTASLEPEPTRTPTLTATSVPTIAPTITPTCTLTITPASTASEPAEVDEQEDTATATSNVMNSSEVEAVGTSTELVSDSGSDATADNAPTPSATLIVTPSITPTPVLTPVAGYGGALVEWGTDLYESLCVGKLPKFAQRPTFDFYGYIVEPENNIWFLVKVNTENPADESNPIDYSVLYWVSINQVKLTRLGEAGNIDPISSDLPRLDLPECEVYVEVESP